MALVSIMLVGTLVGLCLLGTTLVGLARKKKNNEFKKESWRKTSHMAELLQVDMVDRKIKMTAIDCSVEMDLLTSTYGRADHGISPLISLGSSLIR